MQNFIKLSVAVHELSKKLSDTAENNTAITSVGSKNPHRMHQHLQNKNFEKRMASKLQPNYQFILHVTTSYLKPQISNMLC